MAAARQVIATRGEDDGLTPGEQTTPYVLLRRYRCVGERHPRQTSMAQLAVGRGPRADRPSRGWIPNRRAGVPTNGGRRESVESPRAMR